MITVTFASHQAGWFDILKPLRSFASSRRYLPENSVGNDKFYLYVSDKTGVPLQNDLHCNFRESFVVQDGYLHVISLGPWALTYAISMISRREFLWDSPYKETCIPIPKWFI